MVLDSPIRLPVTFEQTTSKSILSKLVVGFSTKRQILFHSKKSIFGLHDDVICLILSSFKLNLINQQRPAILVPNPTMPFSNQNSLAQIYLMCSYESNTNIFQFEILRPTHDNVQLSNAYDSLINNFVNTNTARQKGLFSYKKKSLKIN